MRRMFRVRPAFAKLVAGGVLFAALGGVAYAASGGPFVGGDGSIGGCAPPGGGQVHIWKPGHGCSGGWLSVAFAGSGAKGDRTVEPREPPGYPERRARRIRLRRLSMARP